jgi:hypothetical protein
MTHGAESGPWAEDRDLAPQHVPAVEGSCLNSQVESAETAGEIYVHY